MAEICCPYCNGRNILKIVYCYRGVNKRRQNDFDYSDYLKEGTILMKRTNFEKYDFDGEKIKYCKLPNKYCNDCKKEFNSMRNMAVGDIKKINIVLGNKEYRKKFVFQFYDNEIPTLQYKKDYITVKDIKIYDDDVYNVLSAIKNNKTNLWSGHYGIWDDYDNDYWLLKVEYYNGLTDVKSGNGAYPNNWNNFLSTINDILTKYDIKDL